MSESNLWIGSIVIDCHDLDRMSAFYQAALRYVPRDPPEPDGVVLRDPKGVSPNLSLNVTPESLPRDYRLHLDLYSSDPVGEARRLTGLGATVLEDRTAGRDFLTLADPEGNPIDVIDKSGWTFGRRA